MNRVDVEVGRRYYCEVVDAPAPLAGTFCVEGDDIRASLVRFDAFLPPQAHGTLRVRTEGNWYVSMFDLVPSGWTQTGVTSQRAYIQNTTSNIAVVGWDVWADDDLIRRLMFRIPGLKHIFENSPHFTSVIDSTFGNMPNAHAFRSVVDGLSIKAWLASSGNMSSRRPRDVVPWIIVEFAQGRVLQDLRCLLLHVVQFFSVLSGKSLHATELVISRYSEEQFLHRAEMRLPTPEHRVFRYADGKNKAIEYAEPYSTMVSLWSEADRAALEASLAVWMERRESWAAAGAMMASSLSKQGTMSSSRLLSATRCLEEIPDAAPQKVIAKDHAKALGKVVGRAAKKLGYESIAGRFKSAVSRVSLETNHDRISRLITDAKMVFGSDVVDDHIVAWIAEALNMRGPAAHGARTALDSELEAFARATEAVECLNLLLMVKDLPLGADHQSRMSRHPLVQQYRNMSILGSPKTFRAELPGIKPRAAEL